jgi:hypothetical protein
VATPQGAAPRATPVGPAHGARGRRWVQAPQAGGETGLAAPPRPALSPGLAQAPNAIDRTLCRMQGCQHPGGSQPAWLPALAQLDNLLPSQRRALHAGQGGVAGAGGRLPTHAGRLPLPIRPSGGLR